MNKISNPGRTLFFPNYLICFFIACFLPLTGCGSRVVAVVGGQKIYLDDILMNDHSVLMHAVIANKDKFNHGKMEMTDKAFIDQLKGIKRKEELESLAEKVNQAVVDQVCNQYGLTVVYPTAIPTPMTKPAPIPKAHSSTYDFEKAHKRILEDQKSFMTTALEVKDDQSNIRKVYQKNYGNRMEYSDWLLTYILFGPSRKELQKGLDWVAGEEKKNSVKETMAFDSVLMNGWTAMEETGDKLTERIEQDISKDPLFQRCEKDAEKSPFRAKECRREARKRFWDVKYRELGVKITDPQYQEAEKFFAEKYNLDDPSKLSFEHMKKIRDEWNGLTSNR